MHWLTSSIFLSVISWLNPKFSTKPVLQEASKKKINFDYVCLFLALPAFLCYIDYNKPERLVRINTRFIVDFEFNPQ
jgi:phosphoglycerol transferase MdoB-like AlkP superfamily enzyme